MIDEVDLKILSIIQKDALVPNSEIGRRVGLDSSGVFDRIQEMEKRGMINGYRAHLNPRSFGLELVAFVFVKTDEREDVGKTGELLAKIPEVQEVHRVAGENCYLTKIRLDGTQSLGRLLQEKFEAIESVCSIETTVVLKTVKESTALPLETVRKQAAAF